MKIVVNVYKDSEGGIFRRYSYKTEDEGDVPMITGEIETFLEDCQLEIVDEEGY